ncbi:transcription intermediary factor 1-alpha-like isoform X2 [Glandiceps talaboti]
MSSEASTTVDGDINKETGKIVCGVCKSGFAGRNPKLMPCLHTFCKECITTGDDGAIRCPSCKQDARTLDNIIDNFFILDSITTNCENTTTSTTETDVKCTSCDDNASVTSYCDDCAEWLCDTCVQAHQRVRMTKDHVIQPKESAEAGQKGSVSQVRDKQMMCPLHKQEPLKLYCETCDKLTCRDCQLLGHKEHKYQFVNEAAARQKGQMTALLKKLEEKKQYISTARQRIKEKQNQIHDLENKTSQDIRLFMLTLINEVNRRAKRLLAELKETCAIKKKRLETQAQEVHQLSNLVDHCMSFTANAIHGGSNAALLYTKKTILHQLIAVLRLPAIKSPIFGMDVKFLFDMNNATKQISKFGVLLISDASGQGNNPENVVQQLNRAIQQAPGQAFVGSQTQLSPPQYGQVMYSQQQLQQQQQRVQQQKITLQQLVEQRRQGSQQQGNGNLQIKNANLQQTVQYQNQHLQKLQQLQQHQAQIQLHLQQHQRRQQQQQQHQQEGLKKEVPPVLSHMPHNTAKQQHGAGNQRQATHPRPIAPKPLSQTVTVSGNPVISQVVSLGSLTRLSPSTLRQLSPSVRDLQESVFMNMSNQSNNQVSSASGENKTLPSSPPTMAVTVPFNGGGQQQQTSSTKSEIKSESLSPTERPSCSFARKDTPSPASGTSSSHIDASGLPPNTSRPASNTSSSDDRSTTTPETSSTTGIRIKHERRSIDEPSACSAAPLDFTVKREERAGVDDESFLFPELNLTFPSIQEEKNKSDQGDGEYSDRTSPGPLMPRNDEDESEDYCGCCHNGGDLLCCDTCPKVFHLQCHIPSLTSTPSDTWNCGLCQDISPPSEDSDETEESRKRKGNFQMDEYEHKICQRILLELFCHNESPPFHEPVSKTVPNYYKIVAHPMDLSTIKCKLDSYENVEDFISDCRLVFTNCALFNGMESLVGRAGKKVDKFLTRLLEKYLPDYVGPSLDQPQRVNKRKKRPNEIVHYK